MAALGDELSEEDVQKMVQVADEDNDGMIDFPGEYPLQHIFIQLFQQSRIELSSPVHSFAGTKLLDQ